MAAQSWRHLFKHANRWWHWYPLNPDVAEGVCKETEKFILPNIAPNNVTASLPLSLFTAIKTHGEVMDSRSFRVVENVTTLANCNTEPLGICFNPNDFCLYFCDGADTVIKRLTMQGELSTFVQLDKKARGIYMNYKENVFFVTTYASSTVLKITALGVVSVFAGNRESGSNAVISTPLGISVDQQTGNIFVGGFSSHQIQKITPNGEVSTLAGSVLGFADGKAQAARFDHPYGLCYDEHNQSLLVADYSNNKIRRVLLNGDVSTVCEIQKPLGVAITANKTILVSSNLHQLFRLERIGSNYKAVAIAGSGEVKSVDGKPDKCCFTFPFGIAAHPTANVCFVSDGKAIRKVTFVSP